MVRVWRSCIRLEPPHIYVTRLWRATSRVPLQQYWSCCVLYERPQCSTTIYHDSIRSAKFKRLFRVHPSSRAGRLQQQSSITERRNPLRAEDLFALHVDEAGAAGVGDSRRKTTFTGQLRSRQCLACFSFRQADCVVARRIRAKHLRTGSTTIVSSQRHQVTFVIENMIM